MSNHSIQMGSGIPATELPPVDESLSAAIRRAAAQPHPRDALAALARQDPQESVIWAALGDHGRDDIERYGAYRVGYHRGLDALRANGWRGSGYVRWASPGNQGFLHCLLGLQLAAEAIGETDEAERCQTFLAQLDPDGPPVSVLDRIPGW